MSYVELRVQHGGRHGAAPRQVAHQPDLQWACTTSSIPKPGDCTPATRIIKFSCCYFDVSFTDILIL